MAKYSFEFMSNGEALSYGISKTQSAISGITAQKQAMEITNDCPCRSQRFCTLHDFFGFIKPYFKKYRSANNSGYSYSPFVNLYE